MYIYIQQINKKGKLKITRENENEIISPRILKKEEMSF